MNTNIIKYEQSFLDDIKTIIQQGQSRAYCAINAAMLETYWNLGIFSWSVRLHSYGMQDGGMFSVSTDRNIPNGMWGAGIENHSTTRSRREYLSIGIENHSTNHSRRECLSVEERCSALALHSVGMQPIINQIYNTNII
jgi:hypothetical protein